MKDKIDYKLLSEQLEVENEIYHLAYKDYEKPLQAISTIQSLVVQMYSELIQFKLKTKENKKAIESEKRLNTLLDCLDFIKSGHDDNIALKSILKRKNMEIIRLDNEIENLRKQLEFSECKV